MEITEKLVLPHERNLRAKARRILENQQFDKLKQTIGMAHEEIKQMELTEFL
jgi:hypothetical protein